MSNTDELVIMPRPRSSWQAIDVGFKVARAHYLKLLSLWMILAIPFLIIAELINLLGTTWGIALWWWFKPFFELPLLLYLSKVIFSESISIKDCIKRSLRLFFRMMKTFTGFSRLSLTRSTTSSVVFLENLSGEKRRSRAHVLTDSPTRAYTMMLGCLHVEFILTYVFLAIAVLMAPGYLEDIFPDLLAGELPATAQFIADTTVVIASGLVAPFFVSAGFLIYINRRMRLEAWDIEHQFKNINAVQKKKNQLGSTHLASIAIACICLFFIPAKHSSADDLSSAQNATRSDTKTAITTILNDRDFGGTETRKVPKFIKDAEDRQSANLNPLADFVNSIANVLEIVLWLAAFLAIALIIQFIIKYLPDLDIIQAKPKPTTTLKSALHHPLTQTLPQDITAQAKALLNSGDHRGAISLLFRGALRYLMNEHNIEIATSATEHDCVATLEPHASRAQMNAFSQLVSHWQHEAYAHIKHSSEEVNELILDWENNFSKPSADNS